MKPIFSYGLALLGSLLLIAWFNHDGPDPATEWTEYLGGPDRNHYSKLTQITPENVKNLQVAWSYAAPDTGQMQVNPIIIDGVMYGVTSALRAFALEAATGKERWRFNNPLKNAGGVSRGVAYWSDQDDKRILYTIGSFLYALDARTGKIIDSFGEAGRVDLHTGLPASANGKFVGSHTPGAIFGDLIIMPTRLSEGADAAPGDIRAFNVRTGKLAWSFHTIPYPGEMGYETWPKDAYQNKAVGGANSWAGMSIDRKRGILYVPTGSAAFDFYGGNRKGQNLFANCLLALDARTGKHIWHYQLVHHDLWDRDLPAPPNLMTIRQNNKLVDVVAQTTKNGYVFVFNRVTGKPIFPINEMPVSQAKLIGEATWATQPIPAKPAPFARQSYTLTEKDVSPYAENRDTLVARFRQLGKQPFAPPNKEGTMILPGFDGGAEWGGSAADPEGILYVNSNEMAWVLTMVDTPKQDELAHLSAGEKIYTVNCITCHGADRKGNARSGYPSLEHIETRRDRVYVNQIVSTGKGMMPGFIALTADEKQALVAFLFGEEKKEAGPVSGAAKQPYLRYGFTGYNKFLDSKGLPAISPPWGTLNAINLNTGEYIWKIPFGEVKSLKEKGVPTTGTENYGGPVVTASGLLFIAATKDGMFRAFNKKTGQLLWETKLPAAGFATPSTYQASGKQYVVIACGGGKLGTPKGNQYVAFALP